MGLNRNDKTPCGFCFVEYYTHQDALDCMKYIGGTKLDERIIRTDLDPGFLEGRQYGCVILPCPILKTAKLRQLTLVHSRGKSGGQVRDEYREDFDLGRGGPGAAQRRAEAMETERRKEEDEYGRGR